MVGIFSSVMLAGLLAAGPSGVNFEGPRVTARTTGSTGYFTQGALPFTDLFERGMGSADFSVQERVADPRATYGDTGRFEATFTLGASTYRVELDQVGFPPDTTRHDSGPVPPPPAQPISGGVVVDQDLHGGAPLGAPNMTREHAAAALWGVGRLWRNGQLISDTALIHAAALDRGAHADDDTFRVLPVARPGDAELDVLVWNLPTAAEPRGFIQFDFDDVAIEWNGVPVPVAAVVPNAGSFYGLSPASSPVVGGAALGGVAITSTPTSAQGTGGSGLANANQTVVDGLSDPTRAQQLAPEADVNLPAIANQQGNAIPQAFRNDGRVSLSVPTTNTASGIPEPGTSSVPVIPEPFLTADRIRTANTTTETPSTATANTTSFGTSSLATTTAPTNASTSNIGQPSLLTTSGSYAVLPQLSGPSFAFGGTWIAPSIITTPNPGNEQPAVPLVASPQPLNGLAAVPLIAAPQPGNLQGVAPLVQGIQPLGVQTPSSAVPGATTGFIAPGSSAVLQTTPTPVRVR